jgi:CubicO group peptidase (beta-lactamase class C family)
MILTSFRYLAVLSLLAVAANAQKSSPNYFPPPDSAGGWRTAQDPAKALKVAGIDVKRLDWEFDDAQRTSQHGGLLVARHGWLVYEKYYGKGHRDATPSTASVGKTFTSVSTGIMLNEDKDRFPEGLETKIFNEKYLPEAFPLTDPRKADIKLGQILAMTSGMYEGAGNPGIVEGENVKLDPPPALDGSVGDLISLRLPMWTSPGGGYNYCSTCLTAVSMLIHKVTGMLMQDYINERLAKPMQWGAWGYPPRDALGLPPGVPPPPTPNPAPAATGPRETPGGGGIAVRSTDMIRFAYLLLHKGRWGKQQLIPADYIELASKPSPYNPHSPYGLQFEVNADGHVDGAPRDAFFKSGGGGFGIVVIPSLDMVIWKIAGNDNQYSWSPPDLQDSFKYDGSRDGWKPHPHNQFYDAPIEVDTGVRRTLEMVVASVVK